MSIFSTLLALAFCVMLLVCVLYIIFGQVTLRKLRKNPATKDALGLEFVSGWDIINVAQALSIPRSWSRKLEKSSLSSIYANSNLLLENTNTLDRVLGAVFYWLFMTSGLACALLVLLNSVGLISD